MRSHAIKSPLRCVLCTGDGRLGGCWVLTIAWGGCGIRAWTVFAPFSVLTKRRCTRCASHRSAPSWLRCMTTINTGFLLKHLVRTGCARAVNELLLTRARNVFNVQTRMVRSTVCHPP